MSASDWLQLWLMVVTMCGVIFVAGLALVELRDRKRRQQELREAERRFMDALDQRFNEEVVNVDVVDPATLETLLESVETAEAPPPKKKRKVTKATTH